MSRDFPVTSMSWATDARRVLGVSCNMSHYHQDILVAMHWTVFPPAVHDDAPKGTDERTKLGAPLRSVVVPNERGPVGWIFALSRLLRQA